MNSPIGRFIATWLLLLLAMQSHGQGAITQSVNLHGQGIGGPVVSRDGARLIRTPNGISIAVSMQTPVPFTYAYPPPNPFQPVVMAGSPEVFTGWFFFFNNPGECLVPNACLPPPPGGPAPNDFTRAQGGVYNFAGHAASGGGILNLVGHISVGEAQFGGPSSLQNPQGAEVHIAIAPHGMLQPGLLPNQFRTPIGSPPYWWVALFLAP